MTVLPTLFASQQQGDLPLHEQLVRTLREAILADRASVGLVLGALSLGLGLLNAASLTY